jgi:hypothetical protein
MNDEDIDWIAIVSLCRWDEAPVIWVSEARKKRLGKRENVEFGIKLQLGAAPSRRFYDGIDV